MAAAVDRPQVKIVIADDMPVRPEDFHSRGGFYRFKFFWNHYVLKSEFPVQEGLNSDFETLDIGHLEETFSSEEIPFCEGFKEAEDIDSPFWDDHSLSSKIKNISAYIISPIALERNEYALQDDVPYLFQTLQDLGKDNMLMIFTQIPPVMYRMEEEEKYRGSSTWPFNNHTKELFISQDKGLVDAIYVDGNHSLLVELDPENDSIQDYPFFYFLSETFDEETQIIGQPEFHLHLNNALEDFDLYIGLFQFSDEDQKIQYVKYTDYLSYASIKRKQMVPESVPHSIHGEGLSFSLQGDPVVTKIEQGMRLGIMIRFVQEWNAENPLTGVAIPKQMEYAKGKGELFYGMDFPSRISLPIYTGKANFIEDYR